MDNAILELSLAWPSWYMSHYTMLSGNCTHLFKIKNKLKIIGFYKYSWEEFSIFVGIFKKTIIPLVLVGHEMIIANSALRTSATYHHISNAHSWINC